MVNFHNIYKVIYSEILMLNLNVFIYLQPFYELNFLDYIINMVINFEGFEKQKQHFLISFYLKLYLLLVEIYDWGNVIYKNHLIIFQLIHLYLLILLIILCDPFFLSLLLCIY